MDFYPNNHKATKLEKKLTKNVFAHERGKCADVTKFKVIQGSVRGQSCNSN